MTPSDANRNTDRSVVPWWVIVLPVIFGSGFGVLQVFDLQKSTMVIAAIVMAAITLIAKLIEHRQAFTGRWTGVLTLLTTGIVVTTSAIVYDRNFAAAPDSDNREAVEHQGGVKAAEEAREEETGTATASELGAWDGTASNDGSVPLSSSSETGIGPFILGMPQRTIEAKLGPPEQQFGTDEMGRGLQWYEPDGLEDSYLTVELHGDTVQRAFVALDGTEARIALPHDLVLGSSKFSDLRERFGTPFRIVKRIMENTVFYSVYYQGGPEGTIWYEYGWSSDYGSGVDPGQEALMNLRVTSYGVSHDSPVDDEMSEILDSWLE